MTNDELRQKNFAACSQWLSGHTLEMTERLFTDDGIKRVMFIEQPFQHHSWIGKEMVLQNSRNADDRWEVNTTIDEVHEMLDPNLFFIDLHNECLYHNDDGSVSRYHNSYIQYFLCRDGKLKEWREYFNSCMRAEFDGVKMPDYQGMPPVEQDRKALAARVAAGEVKVPGDYPEPASDDMPEEMLRARNEAIIRRFLATACKDRMCFFAKDAVKKCMFTEKYCHVFQWDGWDLIAENQRRNSAEGNIQITITGMHPGKDPNEFIVEAVGAGPTFGQAGEVTGIYANEYIYLFRLRGGLVVEWREYYNAFARGVQAGILPADHRGPGDPVQRDREALAARQKQSKTEA